MIDNFLPIMTTKNTLQHKKNHKNTKEDYTHKSKSIGEKIGFSAVFADITRSETLPEEASIHKAEMTAIKIGMREIQKKRRHEMGNINTT